MEKAKTAKKWQKWLEAAKNGQKWPKTIETSCQEAPHGQQYPCPALC